MGKKFNILTTISSNEVSLCSKYNSGANKKTEFELVKDREGSKDSNMKEVITKFMDMCVEAEPECCAFHDFLEYWLEYDINNTYYGLLSEALRAGIRDIQHKDISKEEKEVKFKELFNMFIEEFNRLPISKTKNGKYEVSLMSKSHIQEQDIVPQNETYDITKEKTSKMEKQSMFEQAVDLLKSALGLEKTETPAEQPVVEEAPVEEVAITEEAVEEVVEEAPVEKTEEPTTEEPATEEPAVVEEAPAEEVAEPAEVEEAPIEKTVVEEVIAESEVEEVVEEVPVEKTEEPSELQIALEKAKSLENELAELKKAKEEREIEIEKMSFVQKAKDEYSMLVGTPEEIGHQLYSISKSNLDENSKTFIMEQLKKVSNENKEMTEEIGSITKSAGDMTQEEIAYAKAEEIAKSKGISINKALREIK